MVGRRGGFGHERGNEFISLSPSQSKRGIHDVRFCKRSSRSSDLDKYFDQSPPEDLIRRFDPASRGLRFPYLWTARAGGRHVLKPPVSSAFGSLAAKSSRILEGTIDATIAFAYGEEVEQLRGVDSGSILAKCGK